MGPGLLCGFALCAGIFVTNAAGARNASAKAHLVPAAGVHPVGKLSGSVRFNDRVAAIVARKSRDNGRTWADIDRTRLVDQFRLTDGLQPQAQVQPLASMVEKVKRDPRRGMSFGLDGGSANLGPPVDPVARPAEVVAYQLSEASACTGLMPGVTCSTIGGDDVSVRLALALNF